MDNTVKVKGNNFVNKDLPLNCLHNSTIENQRSLIGQAGKSARGMPWHQEPTKDVTSCDKPRGGANIRYIRGFPNGGTRRGNTSSSCVESNRRTRGTA